MKQAGYLCIARQLIVCSDIICLCGTDLVSQSQLIKADTSLGQICRCG